MSQRGCGFFGLASSGFLVYFPTFVLSVDTSVDCHLSFEPLGSSAPLDTLHYAQPRCAPNYYPSEMSPSSSTASPSHVLPVLIEDDVSPSLSSDSPLVCSESSAPPHESLDPIHESMAPPSPSASVDLNSVSHQLQQLIATVGQIRQVLSNSLRPAPLSSPDTDDSTTAQVPETSTPWLLSTLLADKIQCLIHTPGTSFPPVRPCDTANASNTKTHWSAEELHRIMGCRKFQNYKHLLQVSGDGCWIDGGKFPPSLGSFATIPKAKRGGSLDRTK
jgi:hypothetical protein